MPPNSAAGPDGIPAIFIKDCKKSMALPLQIFGKIVWAKVIPQLAKNKLHHSDFQKQQREEALIKNKKKRRRKEEDSRRRTEKKGLR